MELTAALLSRRTTNGAFLPRPVSREHQRVLMSVAAAAPSHFNSQPWRYVLVEDRHTIEAVADISGRSMTALIEQGVFFERYRRYFRFSHAEMEERRDGIFIDHLAGAAAAVHAAGVQRRGPEAHAAAGRARQAGRGQPQAGGGSPLLMAALLDRAEYRPGELSGFYSVFGLGASVGNVWNTVASLGMGIQFVSTPMELPDRWRELGELLRVPPELELMAVYRLGYVPPEERRPSIDWSSRHRKRLSQYVFREDCTHPETD